jgi:uncharacterized protein involved in exopolysaccharide biosynthesis
MNARLIMLLNEFNLQQRQSRALVERRFVESRRAEAEATLREAEASLRQFLERNRTYQSSPELRFEAGRLESAVELQRDVYTALNQAYEQARIEEVRNSPVVTVVQQPEGTAVPARALKVKLVLGAVAGFLLGLTLSFGRELVLRQRQQYPADFARLAELRRSTLRRLLPRRGQPAAD